MLEITFLGVALKQWLIWGTVQGIILFVAWLIVKYGDLGEKNGET